MRPFASLLWTLVVVLFTAASTAATAILMTFDTPTESTSDGGRQLFATTAAAVITIYMHW